MTSWIGSNIRGLYLTCGSKKPLILYDIQEKKIYAYPYKEFKEDLSKICQRVHWSATTGLHPFSGA